MVVTLALAAPAIATADTRQGQTSDAAGDTPAPAQYDQLGSAVTYDRSSGTIDAGLTLGAAPAPEMKETFVSISLGKVDGTGTDASCDFSGEDAGVFGLAVNDRQPGPLVNVPYASDPIEDAATMTVSGTSVRLTAAHPGLSNLDMQCADVASWPYGQAGSGVTDRSTIYFAGYEPVTAWPKVASGAVRTIAGKTLTVPIARGSKTTTTMVKVLSQGKVLAKRSTPIAAGTGTQAVKLTLSAAGRRVLKRPGKLSVQIVVTPQGGPTSKRTIRIAK
jgi:hypothetical protein